MKNKALFITLCVFLTISIVFSVLGFYELVVELEDELGLFFISLSVVPVFIAIGIVIGNIVRKEDNKQ